MSIKWDDKDLKAGANRLNEKMSEEIIRPVREVAFEILRLSTQQVPHDIGLLQMSGKTEPISNTEVLVGYNKVYAARLHEHPEYHFQKGRKGKYLEDPIKSNLVLFRRYIIEGVRDIIKP